MKKTMAGLALLLLAAGSANAALLSRLDGQAYYDTDLDITWLADANLAKTNQFGIAVGNGANQIRTSGQMTWDTAQAWIAAMNAAGYLGYSDWRLPITPQPDATCTSQSGSISYGYNCTGSEMGHLFYGELGGVASQSIAMTHNANYNLFSNVQSNAYWSGTVYAPNPGSAWYFYFVNGYQSDGNKSNAFYAWAVRPGDVVPVPAAVWLFGSGLGVLSLIRRRMAGAAGAGA